MGFTKAHQNFGTHSSIIFGQKISKKLQKMAEKCDISHYSMTITYKNHPNPLWLILKLSEMWNKFPTKFQPNSMSFSKQKLVKSKIISLIISFSYRVDQKKVNLYLDHLERCGFLHGVQNVSNNQFIVLFDNAKF